MIVLYIWPNIDFAKKVFQMTFIVVCSYRLVSLYDHSCII